MADCSAFFIRLAGTQERSPMPETHRAQRPPYYPTERSAPTNTRIVYNEG